MECFIPPAFVPMLRQLCISVLVPEPLLLSEEGDPTFTPFTSFSNMDGVRQEIAMLSQLTSEIKVYLCRMYSAVCSSVDQIKELAMENKYVHSRLSCLESCMDDMDRNIIELLGKVDNIKEDISVFISKPQFSHVQEAPTVNQEMLDAASIQ